MSLFRRRKPVKKSKKTGKRRETTRLVVPMAFATAVTNLYYPSGHAATELHAMEVDSDVGSNLRECLNRSDDFDVRL